MLGSHRVVAVIAARAGSKGVPGKNILPLGGLPLIAWSILAALETPEIDHVVVSTDGADIGAVAQTHGAEVLDRAPELATDDALSADVMRAVSAELRADGEDAPYMVLLQPTSPFRSPGDIGRCLAMLDRDGLDSVATFTEATLHPFRAFRIDNGVPLTFIAGVTPWLPRQRLPAAYELNGAVYAFLADALAEDTGLLFGRSGAVLMDPLRSLDIDDQVDFAVAEALLASGAL